MNTITKCPFRREAEKDLTQKKRWQCDQGDRDWQTQPRTKNIWSDQKLEEARNGLSPTAFGGIQILLPP
jgi:hypothetical protein